MKPGPKLPLEGPIPFDQLTDDQVVQIDLGHRFNYSQQERLSWDMFLGEAALTDSYEYTTTDATSGESFTEVHRLHKLTLERFMHDPVLIYQLGLKAAIGSEYGYEPDSELAGNKRAPLPDLTHGLYDAIELIKKKTVEATSESTKSQNTQRSSSWLSQAWPPQKSRDKNHPHQAEPYIPIIRGQLHRTRGEFGRKAVAWRTRKYLTF